MSGPPIALMAKAPLPGLAKTRLAPALGAAGAAALAERLLEHAAGQAALAALGKVTLWATPDCSHPVFARLQRRHGLALALQGAGDIGQRMAQVFAAARGPLLLMGTDVPGITAAVLRQAAELLSAHDAVFVPALDGGYGLIGLQRHAPSLFGGIAWSTSQVMATTRLRLAEAGLRPVELPALADIDLPADLARLDPSWFDTADPAPRQPAP